MGKILEKSSYLRYVLSLGPTPPNAHFKLLSQRELAKVERMSSRQVIHKIFENMILHLLTKTRGLKLCTKCYGFLVLIRDCPTRVLSGQGGSP